MGNPAALGHGQLRRANIEVAVNLKRIAIHHFAVEHLGDPQSELTFSRARWTSHCNQWVCPCVHVIGARSVCRQTPLYNKNVFSTLAAALPSQPGYRSRSNEVRSA